MQHAATAAISLALSIAVHACSSEPPAAPAAPVTPGAPAATTPAGPSAAGTGAAGSGTTTGSGTVTQPAAAAGSSSQPMAAGPAATAGAPAEVPAGPGPAAGSGASPDSTPTAMQTSPSDWTSMGYDLASTYNNVGETKLTKETAKNLKEAWSVDLGGQVLGAALMIGDKMYATAPGTVRAFEVATGKELWQYKVSSTSALTYANGTLYLHSLESELVAINAADGAELWAKRIDTQMGDGSSSPLVFGETIVIGGANGNIEVAGGEFRGHLAALNRMTGEKLWTTYTVPEGVRGASVWASPTVDLEAGVIYGATGNNYGMPATDTSDAIIQFDIATGAIKWKAQRVENDTFGNGTFFGPDHDFGANPVLIETMVGGAMTKLVSAGAKSGTAHALRRDTGEVVWSRSLCSGAADGSRGIFTNSAWTGKNMIFGCNEGGPATLYALDGATGDIVWMRALPGQVWGRIALANGVGVVGAGTTLEVFDVETGAVITSVMSKGGTIASTVTISNGRVAFGEGLSWASQKAGKHLTVLSIE